MICTTSVSEFVFYAHLMRLKLNCLLCYCFMDDLYSFCNQLCFISLFDEIVTELFVLLLFYG